MVPTICRSLVAALVVSASASASWAEPTLLFTASDIQSSAQLVAAAIATGDTGELRRQTFRLSEVIGQALERGDRSARYACVMAAQNLHNAALDIYDLPPARRMIGFERDVKLFREQMTACETAVGLKPPRSPNLR